MWINKLLAALGFSNQSSSVAAPQAAPTPAPAPAPPPGPQPTFVLAAAASAYLDGVWLKNQNTIFVLPAGTPLWHAGLVGPNNPAVNTRGLWTTRNALNRTNYNGWAKQEATARGMTAYLTEYKSNKDLSLADFNSASLLEFTATHCNASHDNMKQALMAWVKAKPNLRGVFATNGGPDELAIGFPQDDLDVGPQQPL